MRPGLVCALVVAGIAFIPAKRRETPERPDPKAPTLHLCLEIQALRTLYLLRTKPDQLQKLQEIAKRLAIKERDRAKPRASDEYRGVLASLHAALAADDQDEVEDLEDQLSGLTDSEEPDIDDAITITDDARKHVPEALRILTPQQIAEYLGSIAEDVGDPRQRLAAALEKVRSDKENDWEQIRDDLADDLSGLLGGLDAARSKNVHDAIVSLLNKSRKLDADAFDKQRSELKKDALAIGGDVAPTTVLAHAAERALARLLSNPRLSSALEARLKRAK
jgi:hypothetical protein